MTALTRLAATISARKSADPESSWTAKLLAKGPEKCAEKFGEEAIEAIIEAVKGDRPRLISEAADTLYHLLVMLAARDITEKLRMLDVLRERALVLRATGSAARDASVLREGPTPCGTSRKNAG